jgi:hypothetical protein
MDHPNHSVLQSVLQRNRSNNMDFFKGLVHMVVTEAKRFHDVPLQAGEPEKSYQG